MITASLLFTASVISSVRKNCWWNTTTESSYICPVSISQLWPHFVNNQGEKISTVPIVTVQCPCSPPGEENTCSLGMINQTFRNWLPKVTASIEGLTSLGLFLVFSLWKEIMHCMVSLILKPCDPAWIHCTNLPSTRGAWPAYVVVGFWQPWTLCNKVRRLEVSGLVWEKCKGQVSQSLHLILQNRTEGPGWKWATYFITRSLHSFNLHVLL